MGLDCSHDAWSGAYSAFSRWRNIVAEAAGYKIENVSSGDGYAMLAVNIDWESVTDANLQGVWKETPEDPLVVLIAHSDCGGSIYPEQAAALSKRLKELLPKLEGDLGGHVGNLMEKTQQFIDGLDVAVDAEEPLEFY